MDTKNLHLPIIESNETKKSVSKQANSFVLPSLSKSSSSTSFNSKPNSARSSRVFSPDLAENATVDLKRSTHDIVAVSSSSINSSLNNNNNDEAFFMSNKVEKYYYLHPLYVHPDRKNMDRIDQKRKPIEIPASFSYKVLIFIYFNTILVGNA